MDTAAIEALVEKFKADLLALVGGEETSEGEPDADMRDKMKARG